MDSSFFSTRKKMHLSCEYTERKSERNIDGDRDRVREWRPYGQMKREKSEGEVKKCSVKCSPRSVLRKQVHHTVQVHPVTVMAMHQSKGAQPVVPQCRSHEGLQKAELADASFAVIGCHRESHQKPQNFSDIRKQTDAQSHAAGQLEGCLEPHRHTSATRCTTAEPRQSPVADWHGPENHHCVAAVIASQVPHQLCETSWL